MSTIAKLLHFEAVHLLWHSGMVPTLNSFNSCSSACGSLGKWQYSLCVLKAA